LALQGEADSGVISSQVITYPSIVVRGLLVSSRSIMSNALGGLSTIFALLKDVSSLVPQAGPLAQVLGITKELIGIINQMRDNGEGCSYLAERILKFLKKLSEESVRLNEPIREGSPTALRLMELQS